MGLFPTGFRCRLWLRVGGRREGPARGREAAASIIIDEARPKWLLLPGGATREEACCCWCCWGWWWWCVGSDASGGIPAGRELGREWGAAKAYSCGARWGGEEDTCGDPALNPEPCTPLVHSAPLGEALFVCLTGLLCLMSGSSSQLALPCCC